MRASTLFALTAAVLIGLGVAVAAKMGGYFNKPAEAVVVKQPDVQVLVANRNLYKGDTIDATGVRVRVLREEEKADYNANKAKYPPAVPAAAYLRIANQNVIADKPITNEMMAEMAKPAPLSERLLPDHRAINIMLTKERSAGGLVQVGEWVELYLTSTIDTADGEHVTRTAAIVPQAKLIAKRDTLFPIFAPLPKDKPVEYTLEVSSYRAELIEFSRSKGNFSLTPLPISEQKKADAERTEKLEKVAKGIPNDAVVAAVGEEVQEEVQLARQYDRGELVVGEHDLIKLFDIKVGGNAPPPPVILKVERFSGTRQVGEANFTLDGKPFYGDPTGGTATGGPTYGGAGGNVYPRPPYSPNVRLNSGQMINTYYNWGGHGGRGGAQGGNGNVRFTQPDCPTCNSRKNR